MDSASEDEEDLEENRNRDTDSLLIPGEEGPPTAGDNEENVQKNKIFTMAPAENQRPISIFTDPNVEELCFPEIFIGKGRMANEDRKRPMQNHEIIKSEILNTDRRCAQNIPNLFYKLRKTQIKHVSGKGLVAMRRKTGKNLQSALVVLSSVQKMHFLSNQLHG